MTIRIVRGFFVAASIIMGGMWAFYVFTISLGEGRVYEATDVIPWILGGMVMGAIISLATLFFLKYVTQEVFERMSPALVTVILGMLTGYILGQYIADIFFPGLDAATKVFIICTLLLLFGFIGIFLGMTRASNWESLIRAVHRRNMSEDNIKILDTSVLIDGRLADISATGFLDGVFLIPRFVLRELQDIADSSDMLRRARGRRGLDIVKDLQDPKGRVRVIIVDDDPREVAEVDAKLVVLAQQYRGRIVTNDVNLNKIAQIDGVEVLNINDLANALKPAVLPDETMAVKIIKEGKEASQGVGYLDDGTMIVVDGGRAHVGEEVLVVVTSVLQTSAGRMIFTKLQQASA